MMFKHSRLIFFVLENPLAVTLDKDLEACIDQSFGDFWRDGRAMLEFLLFAAEPEGLLSHAELLNEGVEMTEVRAKRAFESSVRL